MGNPMENRCVVLIVCLAVCSSLSAQAADPAVVRLEGQPNFRDLGGYTTSDGRTVKSGLIFRSGELPRLTDDDVSKLERLGIKTVVNFLTDLETEARGEDRLPPGVREIALPIRVGDDLARVGLEARRTGDFSKVPPAINPEAHKVLITEATAEYAALLRELADPAQRPLVFHCSHGVHRTGTASAIVLSALGVPWETVRRDYLLSNEHRKEEVGERLGQLRAQAAKIQGAEPDQVDMTNANAFYILQPSYIDASLEEAVNKYGSMEEYIREGLGIEDEIVEKLRADLLE